MALVVMGLAAVALLGAFASSISGSATHRSLTSFDIALRSAAENATSQIEDGTNPSYESCAPVSYYQAGGAGAVTFTPPDGYSAQITSVQYWDTATSTWIAPS